MEYVAEDEVEESDVSDLEVRCLQNSVSHTFNILEDFKECTR